VSAVVQIYRSPVEKWVKTNHRAPPPPFSVFEQFGNVIESYNLNYENEQERPSLILFFEGARTCVRRAHGEAPGGTNAVPGGTW